MAKRQPNSLNSSSGTAARISQLENELTIARAELARTVQEMEVANEELRSTNEELQLLNAKLQASNDELESSREEIQASSINLEHANTDLENLLRSTRIATVFLDRDLLIRSFTPAATEIYGLRATDVNRPLTDLRPLAEIMPPLPQPDTLGFDNPVEHTILTHSGKYFIRRVLPYLNSAGERDGLVITFTDVTQLQTSEEMLRRSLAAATMDAFDIDLVKGSIKRTGALHWLLGLEECDCVQKFLARVHPNDKNKFEADFKGCTSDNPTYSSIFRFQSIDGNWYWLRDDAEVFFDEADRPIRIIGSRRDVTQQQSLMEDIIDREAHLRRVIDSMIGFVGVLDSEGTLLEANMPALEHGGLRRNDVIGKKFWDCYWWNFDQAVAEKLRHSIEIALTGQIVRYDTVVRMAGGTRIVIDFMLVPVRNEAGRIKYLIPSGVDITDRIEAQRSQRETAKRLEMALKASGMSAWEWTEEQSFWTPGLYELIGISTDEVAHQETFFRSVHPDDIDGLRAEWAQTIRGESNYEHEFRVVLPDGEIRWVYGVGEFERDADGNVLRIYGMNWDSTKEHVASEALRESERRAKEANLSKSEFLANMSHEIRTPMTAIIGYADILARNLSDPNDTKCVTIIRHNGQFLLDIINDILDISKIEAGKLELIKKRFRIDHLLSDLQSLMGVRAVEKLLNFKIDIEGEIPASIRSDAKRLKQILVNLIGNAIKFTDSGTVQVICRFLPDARPTKLQFDVIDSGIGMNNEQLTKLFQPFTQANSAVDRKFGGTGLGLTISKRLTEMLGGEIFATSRMGQGSKFSFTIATGSMKDVPLVIPASTRSTPIASKQNIEQETGLDNLRLDAKILVVDDRRDIRFIAQHFITSAGGTVVTGENGEEAIAKIEQAATAGEPFNLIVLDMQMPVLDGYEATRRLRAAGFTQPIIALTAHAMDGDRETCLAAGCSDYLTKPLDGTKFIELLARYLT